MSEQKMDLVELVDRMAELVNLPIPAEYRTGVVDNFSRIQEIAQLVIEFPLPEEIEAAPTFDPEQ